MKAVILALCILGATAAFAQSGITASTLSAEPQVVQMFSHPQHATAQPMAIEHDLRQGSQPVHAQGVRPLWELGTLSNEVPLGDIARALRKERENGKKAEKNWAN